MKKGLTLVFTTFLLFNVSAIAQDSLTVSTVSKNISKGNQPGFAIDIPLATSKKVMANWKRIIKRNKGEDLSRGKEYKYRVLLPEVGRDTLFIYSITEESKDRTTHYAFISQDDSVFSNSNEYADGFSRFLRANSVHTYRESVTGLLEAERIALGKLEDGLETLNKQADNWHKEIKSNEREMDRIRDQIAMDKKEQDMKNDAIFKQKQVVATYQTPSEQKEAEEKKLKDLEKEKKKIMSKIESENKKIDDLEAENRGLERRIAKNMDELIPSQNQSISKQKQVIQAINDRLTSVR